MWKPDEPNGRFGRWGQVASALTTFGILGFVIGFVVLDWLVDAPAWALWAASVPIALFSVAWGFTVVDDEDDPEPAQDADEEATSHWVYSKPRGALGWLFRIVSIWFSFAGLLWLSDLLLIQLLDLPERAWTLSGFPLLAFAIALQMFDIEDDAARDPDLSPKTPAGDNANKRFHERARA